MPSTANFRAALRMPGVVLLCFNYFFWSAGLYGFVLWLPTIIRMGSARGIETVGLLNAAPFLLAVIVMLCVAYFSDRALSRKVFIWPFLIFSGAALFVSFMTAGHSFWIAYAFLIIAGAGMYAPYGPFFAIMPEMLPKNVVGEVIALVNSCGALGAFAGTWLVGPLQSLTGNSRAGYFFMSMSLMLSGMLIIRLRMPRASGRSRERS